MTHRLFDVHAHLISDDPRRYPYAPLGGKLDESVLADPITAERLLAEMPQSGVARAIVVQRAHVYGVDNSYVADAAAAHPDRFRALVLVNPLVEKAGAAARRWIETRGAVGVRLTAPSQECGLDWLSSPAALGAWDAVAELGASMRVHFYAWNRDAGLDATLQLARRYRSTNIVLDHLSNLAPDAEIDARLKAVAACSNVSIMFSTINVQKAAALGAPLAPLLQRIVGEFGAERVMWGSDVGQSKVQYSRMIEMAVESVSELKAAEQQQVLWSAADRIYGDA